MDESIKNAFWRERMAKEENFLSPRKTAPKQTDPSFSSVRIAEQLLSGANLDAAARRKGAVEMDWRGRVPAVEHRLSPGRQRQCNACEIRPDDGVNGNAMHAASTQARDWRGRVPAVEERLPPGHAAAVFVDLEVRRPKVFSAESPGVWVPSSQDTVQQREHLDNHGALIAPLGCRRRVVAPPSSAASCTPWASSDVVTETATASLPFPHVEHIDRNGARIVSPGLKQRANNPVGVTDAFRSSGQMANSVSSKSRTSGGSSRYVVDQNGEVIHHVLTRGNLRRMGWR